MIGVFFVVYVFLFIFSISLLRRVSTMALKPIKKKRLFEEIIIEIEKYIQEEQIQPGDKLPSENDLVTIFNVSKTAVREAIAVLKANNIIETRSGSGIFLKDTLGESITIKVTSNLMKKEDLREILDFRRAFEVEAVRLAALRGTDEQINAIAESHKDLLEINTAGSLGIDEDLEFHYQIIKASQNKIFIDLFEKVSNKVKEVVKITKMQVAKDKGNFEEGNNEHRLIVEALKQRNPEEAARVMYQHLVRNERKLWNNIKK